MSYTPCPYCGEPLLGYPGSACSSATCVNKARPNDPNPYAKTADGSSYLENRRLLYPTPAERTEDAGRRARKRAFKGIR